MVQIPIRINGANPAKMTASCLADKGNGIILHTEGLTQGRIFIEISAHKDSWHPCLDDFGAPLTIEPNENLIVELENAPYYIRAMYEGPQDIGDIILILRNS